MEAIPSSARSSERCRALDGRIRALIANALKQHYIGLEEVDDGVWAIYFCAVLLARLDERDFIIRL